MITGQIKNDKIEKNVNILIEKEILGDIIT